MKALDRAYAELEKHRRGMPEDVLDQYVHRDAVQAAARHELPRRGARSSCAAGKLARGAAEARAVPRSSTTARVGALEGSLAALRGDKFSDEQKKLDEVMNELADVAKDQDDIAAEANRIFEAYARKADEVAKDHRREASKKVGALVEKLRKRLEDINESGLTPFAKEELDIVERRLADVEQHGRRRRSRRGARHGAPGQAEPRHDRRRARGRDQRRSEVEVGRRDAGRARRRRARRARSRRS